MENTKDPLLLSAFRTYLQEMNVFRIRVACVLGFTLVPLFSLLDYFVIRHQFRTFLLIRLACTTTTLLLFLFSFIPLGRKNINLVGGVSALLIGGTISLMIRYSGGYESPYYAGLNLLMLGITLLFAWEIKTMAGICLSIYSFYMIPILLYDEIRHPEVFINNNAFLLSTVVIALTSAHFVSRLRYQEFESLYKLEESRRALEASNEKLKQLRDLKDRFFADISHELRTPLAVIRGEAEVTLRGKDRAVSEYKRVLHDITLLVEQLNKLVCDLLFLARSESGAIQIEKKAISLQKILEEVYRDGKSLSLQKEITISLGNNEKEIIVQGDPQRLKQLFMIITDNAIHYSKMGGRVDIYLKREGPDQAKVVISDDGIGIPQDALPHVFERFYRAEKSRSMAHGGAGLGLPIAKWIAEAHNGKISIASVLGNGTQVTIFLPISENDEGLKC